MSPRPLRALGRLWSRLRAVLPSLGRRACAWPGARRDRLRDGGPLPLLAAAVAGLAGLAVFGLATTLFAHHSHNHDEAVYLMQAAMLLEGQLELYAGDPAGAFRPWFFVRDGGRLYPRYAPVPAAGYAVSMALFDEPRVTLAAVAAGNAALVYLLGATAFDRRVGVVAAVAFAASPMALVSSAVFLPYAPTTLLNLAFAVAYLRSVRDGSLVAAGVAGLAVGLAFFARPFTAVLFATPFVVHALVRTVRSIREAGPRPLPDTVRRHGLTALVSLLFVGLTLAYNLRLTGSPLVFPYQAFAPIDGPGFGRRRLLEHAVDYTPALALRSNGYVLWYLATRWVVGGPIGTVVAVTGLGLAIRRWRRGEHAVGPGGGGDTARDADGSGVPFERTAGGLLVGVVASVTAGNVLFWGNYNVLGTPSDPTDGFVGTFGPFYHFDLLVPVVVFAAVAAVAGWEARSRVRTRLERRLAPRGAALVLACVLAASLLVVGAATGAALAGPLERNAAHAEKVETAYEPFAGTTLRDALVFVPTPYGDWLHHPFQALRNEPDRDGPVVYALDRDPGSDFAVLDAYPGRTAYRYTYRGEWTPDHGRHVTPTLQRLAVRRGSTLAGETTVGVPHPEHVDHATIRLAADSGGHARAAVDDPGESIRVRWTVDGDAARLAGADADAEADTGADPGADPGADADAGAGTDASGAVSLAGTDAVVLTVTLVQPDGSTLTYRQEATVRTDGDRVEVVWPPERTVCPLVTDCGRRGTYLPDDPDAHREGVSFETALESRGS